MNAKNKRLNRKVLSEIDVYVKNRNKELYKEHKKEIKNTTESICELISKTTIIVYEIILLIFIFKKSSIEQYLPNDLSTLLYIFTTQIIISVCVDIRILQYSSSTLGTVISWIGYIISWCLMYENWFFGLVYVLYTLLYYPIGICKFFSDLIRLYQYLGKDERKWIKC